MLQNGRRYFVWTLDDKEEVVEGFGPYTLLEHTRIHARIKAQKGTHDVSVTTDPKGKDFRVVRVYEKGTGKTLVRDGERVKNPPPEIEELYVP